MMNVAIYLRPGPGIEQDGQIMYSAIEPVLREHNGTVGFLRAPMLMPRHLIESRLKLKQSIDCAIFMERIIDHPELLKAKHRILIPNPEWLDKRTLALATHCTHVWHKSHFSLERLKPIFPRAQHTYIGFTSADYGQRVASHDSFVHLRGNLLTNRSTDCILAHWQARPELPDLHVQFYWKQQDGIQYPGWLHDNNVHIRIGWLRREDYFALARTHGIHLCTSEVEGFGHYINEARAMGALVVTTNGPPMNELVDVDSGILVKSSATRPMNLGTRFIITPDDLAAAIDQVLALSVADRRALGQNVRERFLAEGDAFRETVQGLIAQLQSA